MQPQSIPHMAHVLATRSRLIALSASAGLAIASGAQAAGAEPIQVQADASGLVHAELNDTVVRLEGTAGVLDAKRPMRVPPGFLTGRDTILDLDGSGPSILGTVETFDTEVIIASDNTLAIGAYLSSTLEGQSAPFVVPLGPAGTTVYTPSNPIVAGGLTLDNGDGTLSIVVGTATAPLSDGLLPLGVTLGPSMIPATTLAWGFGDVGINDRDMPLAPDTLVPELPGFAGSGFTVVAIDFFLLDNGMTIGSGSFGGLPLLNQTQIDGLFAFGGADGFGIDEMQIQYLVEDATAPTLIELTPTDTCLNAAENQLVVEIDVSGLKDLAVGGQYFLQYDPALLDFVSAEAGDGPFTVELFEDVDETLGTIDYFVGVPNGDIGTAVPTTTARLTFDLLDDFCSETELVSFRTGPVPTRLTNDQGVDLGAITANLAEVRNDNTAPMIAPISDFTVNADAGGCDAFVAVPILAASDDCGIASIVNDFNGTDDASGVYPGGSTTVVWTVTDDCGNATQISQVITVNPSNSLDVVVELAFVTEGPGITVDGDLDSTPGEWDAMLSNGVATSGSDTVEVYSAWGDDGLYLAFASNDMTDGRDLDEDDQLSVNIGLAGNTLTSVWDQGFEFGVANGWFDENNGWSGSADVVSSGTNGITSASGSSHAIYTQTNGAGGLTGPFSRFDMYRDTWTGGQVARMDIYLDTSWALGEGFDYSVSSSNNMGGFRRDFIFHVTKDTSTGSLLVGGSNNTNFDPREDLDTINNVEITASGWYSFEHRFRDAGDGTLAVDLNLYDSGGVLLFTETRNTPLDVIATEIGGNRYAWFTNIDIAGGIAVDNHSLSVNTGSDWRYAWDAITTAGANEGPVGDNFMVTGSPGDYWGVWRAGDDSLEDNETFGTPSAQVNTAPAATGIVQATGFVGGTRVTELFIPNAELFDGVNGWTLANRDDVRFMGFFTPDMGGDGFVYPNGGDFGDQGTYLSVAGTLAGTAASLDRCITFELTGMSGTVVVNETLSFINGVAVATIDVPCGDYTCIRARDELHTLARVDDEFGIVGTAYSADFTGSGPTDDSLIGGNLNNDGFIDILDFGVFIAQFGDLLNPDTPCGTPPTHADISGNGEVDVADFTFINNSFLVFGEGACSARIPGETPGSTPNTQQAGTLSLMGDGPVTSVRVADLIAAGMPELAFADLNRDGILDADDVGAFLAGVRPDVAADVNDDAVINILDLVAVLEAFQSGDATDATDVNNDGAVDIADILFVIDRLN